MSNDAYAPSAAGARTYPTSAYLPPIKKQTTQSADPYAPPNVSAPSYDPSSLPIQTSSLSPDPVRDIFLPKQMQVSEELENALQPPNVSGRRQFFGSLVSSVTNPQIGGLITGDTQRNRQIGNLERQSEVLDNTIRANQQQRMNDLNSQNVQADIALRGAQSSQARARANALNNPPPKVGLTSDDETFNDLMAGDNGNPRVNPQTDKPYTALEANQAVKQLAQTGKRFTDPFEAFAYGSPQEKQSAQDFITFQKQTEAKNQRPGETEARYSLYKRDPQAYTAMFGNHDSAQDSRDQAQATRMLRYFGAQRTSIQKDYTLDDAEKQKQLGQIDELEAPYLDIAQPQPGAGTNAQGAAPQATRQGGRGNVQQYKLGDPVMYKGQQMRVSRVRPDGKLELQPMAGGTQ
jgi:hypothetical protein